MSIFSTDQPKNYKLIPGYGCGDGTGANVDAYSKQEIDMLLKKYAKSSDASPSPSVDYKNSVYFNSTDNTFYTCEETSSGIYEWVPCSSSESSSGDKYIDTSGVTIAVVDILPTPDVSIKDKYYLLSTNDKIYKCVEDVNNPNNYIFQEISSTGIQIVNNYSILSSLPTEESIVYCKEDYVDITNNETYVKGFYFYDTISSEWILISSKSKDYPNWESNILYEINDIVTYDNKHYKCLKEHTSSVDFNDDKNNWYRAIEQYYVVTQEQYDELIQQGIINDDTIDLYIIMDEQEEESIKTIVQDYSLLPEIDLLTEDIIIYCKDDYIDENNTTYKKGFYLANKTTNVYTPLVETINEIPTLDWISGVTGKPFENLSTDLEVVNDELKLNPHVHDTINTEIQALKSAIDKSATINDESVLATDTWSAKKIILELDTKASKDTEHIHDNKLILDKFNEDINGLPTYNGSSFMTTAIYDTDNNGIIDKATEAEKLTGMIATIDEINYLTGATGNIQQQIISISSGMLFKGEFDTFAQMTSTLSSPEKGWLVYILQDEKTNQENVQYVHNGNDWVYGGGRTVVNEASNTIKGTILLAGDLTGTASSPQLKDVTTASTVGYIKGLEVDSKGRILSITEDSTLAERIAKLEARPQVYVSTDEPQNMINGDIWIQA